MDDHPRPRGISALARRVDAWPHDDHDPGRPSPEPDVVVYDVETSDTHPRHGQILQFGCVRADNDLRPVPGGGTVVDVRRLPYVLPHPDALSVTGFDVASLDDRSRTDEFDAAVTVERALSCDQESGRLYLGYNSRFDDEFVRTLLFRNLLRPWFNSGRDATRVDVMALVQLAVTHRPGCLATVTHPNGKIDWRLKSMCEVNGIPIRAHDAMGDAAATLELAGMVRANAPWAWEKVARWGNSDRAQTRLRDAARDRSVIWVFGHFGDADVAPCRVLGTDGRKNWLLADLRLGADAFPADLSDLWRLTGSGKPLVRLKAGACRPLFDADEAAKLGVGAYREDGGPDRETADALLRVFERKRDDREEPVTSEGRIYDGFPGRRDEATMRAFHAETSWHQRAVMPFSDPRLADFAARICHRRILSGEFVPIDPGLESRLAHVCREAYSRPTAEASEAWTTIAGAEPAADAGWSGWVKDTWPDYEPPKGQIGFGF